jgi:serine/threonine-protein kinase
LSHPNIVSIFDAGEEHDMAYIAMELLEGGELTDYCSSDNLLPVEQVLEIISAVASALEYAHREGVVHRDIKPSNIMLVKDHLVKVTDFGIARIIDVSQTRTGIALGTPSYMSPEQVSGKKVDGRSDLFSLGIVFYELLTGKRPFAADTVSSILYAIIHSDYPPLSANAGRYPPCCIDIINKLLKKGLTARFRSASQVIKAIETCRTEL